MQVQAYLTFEGRCEEALAFYKQAIGATVTMMMRFKDSPDKSMCTPANENSIMHAAMTIGSSVVMASDGMGKAPPKFEGFALSLDAANQLEADKLFKGLADGGTVTMPPVETFFAKTFGMVKDKFGVHWMVIVAKPM